MFSGVCLSMFKRKLNLILGWTNFGLQICRFFRPVYYQAWLVNFPEIPRILSAHIAHYSPLHIDCIRDSKHPSMHRSSYACPDQNHKGVGSLTQLSYSIHLFCWHTQHKVGHVFSVYKGSYFNKLHQKCQLINMQNNKQENSFHYMWKQETCLPP